jgi:hypothetical protein
LRLAQGKSRTARAGHRTVTAGAALATFIGFLNHARAEFEIPEVDAEKGAFEAEYRGAQHWGLPRPGDDGDSDALRQSHEVELQYGLTDWWMLRLTPNLEQPAGEALELASLGLETQFVLIPRRGGLLGLALMAGYGPYSLFVEDDTPDEFEFGPVLELAPGPWLLTLNPRLVDQIGKHTDQEWLGFEYAAQLKYRLTKRWAVAVLGFGEIEDLANAGPFESQAHVLGPSLYLSSRHEEGQNEAALGAGQGREWNLGVGVLFGLTDAAADTALRVTLAVEY